jgi:hypothetical protein
MTIQYGCTKQNVLIPTTMILKTVHNIPTGPVILATNSKLRCLVLELRIVITACLVPEHPQSYVARYRLLLSATCSSYRNCLPWAATDVTLNPDPWNPAWRRWRIHFRGEAAGSWEYSQLHSPEIILREEMRRFQTAWLNRYDSARERG